MTVCVSSRRPSTCRLIGHHDASKARDAPSSQDCSAREAGSRLVEAPCRCESPDGRLTQTPTYRWVTVAAFTAWVKVNEAVERRPSSVAHAKEMGTWKTACGIPCEFWVRIWEVPFRTRQVGLDVCGRCASAVRDA